MSTTVAFMAVAVVTMATITYYIRSLQVSKVLKCVVTHSRQDPYMLAFRQGVAEVCQALGVTLDWVNVPEPGLHVLGYRDALMSEGKGHSTVLCQYLPDMPGDLQDYLPHDVHSAVVINTPDSNPADSDVLSFRVGLDVDVMLQRILQELDARPAIVCLPWFVDGSKLDGQVTVERYTDEALLSRARSDTIKTIILPDDPSLDYHRVRSLFTNVRIGIVSVIKSSNGDACVWQDPRDQGKLASLLALSEMLHGQRLLEQKDVHTDVKFART